MSRNRPYPSHLRLAQKHVRMALAAVIRLQASIGDNHPSTAPVRSARGFAQLALKMLEAARHQSIYSPSALSAINFPAISRAEAAFTRQHAAP